MNQYQRPAGSRRPQPIAEVLSELLARRGYARVEASAQLAAVWRETVGDLLAESTMPGRIRGHTLEIVVADSTLVQEFTIRKAELLSGLNHPLPERNIRDLRFRVGPVR